MSYQVIARKYRPQRFSDVVGQEHVTQTLRNAIEQGRIAHAYLFVGPRGTGKTTIARIFAKCLNCTGGPKVDFDDNDPRCQEIAEGRSLDVLEIDAASNRGIDEIRSLRETVKYAPATSKFKVYIIDEVHMLTKEAFNALLKTLEEPPAHVKFMFATTEAEKVLPTILSRCQRFDLRRIPTALIVKHLGEIARQEKITIDEDALFAIARGAEGGMRDAESTLDQLISFCGEKITEADVLSMFGLTARSQIVSLAGALIAGEIEPALRELDALAKNGKDLGRLITDLLNHFRNLLIFQVSRGDLGLLAVSEQEAASLKEQTGQINVEALTRMMEVLADCEARLRDAASKRVMIEVSLFKAVEARNATSIDVVLQQLEALRGAGSGGGRPPASTAPAAPPRPAPAPARTAPPPKTSITASTPTAASPVQTSTPAVAATAGNVPAGDLEQLWANILELVGRASPFARSYLGEAHPVSLERKVLTIGFDPEFADHVGLVDNSKNRTLLQTKLEELGQPGVQVKFIIAEAPTARAARAADLPALPSNPGMPSDEPPPAPAKPATRAPLQKEDFKNDPLIRAALDIFKGQIVEVRT